MFVAFYQQEQHLGNKCSLSLKRLPVGRCSTRCEHEKVELIFIAEKCSFIMLMYDSRARDRAADSDVVDLPLSSLLQCVTLKIILTHLCD